MTAQESQEAYAGIDLAIAKKKRLPVVVVVRRAGRLEPLASTRVAPRSRLAAVATPSLSMSRTDGDSLLRL